MQLQNKEPSASQRSVVLQKRIFWRPGWRMWRSDWFLPLSVFCESNSSYVFLLLLVQECKYCTDTSSTASQDGARRLNTKWIPADGASHRSVSVLQTHSDELDEVFFIFILGWRASASVLLVSSFGINHSAPFFRLLVKDALLFSFSLSGLWLSGIFKGAVASDNDPPPVAAWVLFKSVILMG